jgi:hypothetical protein
MNKKQLEQISGVIITSFVNLHFLEEASKTGLFRQRLKNNVRRTITDLLEVESKYFNKIDEVDDKQMGDKLIANNIEFVKWILNKFDYNDFTKIQEVCIAYSLDKEKMTKASDEVLLSNGAEKID